MSDSIRKRMESMSKALLPDLEQAEKQLGYLKESLALAVKMGEDISDEQAAVAQLEAMIASLKKAVAKKIV
jgi:hypothetical protein